jgi:hypothetical protein
MISKKDYKVNVVKDWIIRGKAQKLALKKGILKYATIATEFKSFPENVTHFPQTGYNNLF